MSSTAARALWIRRGVVAALLVAVVCVVVLRAMLLHTININWDEFHFLSLVHTHLRGELTTKLLSFHVHFFGWATTTSPNEAQQVLRMREVMFVLSLVSAACMGFIAWRLFHSAAAAAFSVLIGQATAFVMHHGSSARFDSLVTTFAALAAALIVARNTAATPLPPLRARLLIGGAGACFAIATLFSIKSALVVPMLIALFAWSLIIEEASPPQRWRITLRDVVKDVVIFGVVAAVVFAMLFAVHVATLAASSAVAKVSTGGTAKEGNLLDIFARQFPGDVLPTAAPFIDTLRWDFAFWLLFGAGAAVAFAGIGAGGATRKLALRALCFALPVASIALYRNAFSYFYVCVLPYAAVLAALVVARIEQRLGDRRPFIAAAIVLALALPSTLQAFRWRAFNGDNQVRAQISTVDVVHHVFPKPVPYVDRCGMIGAFPKVGMFMTTWALEDYRRAKRPVMRDVLVQGQPQFLLANVESLELAKPYSTKQSRRLLAEDFTTLQSNFVQHWGPLWVAGTSLTFEDSATKPFELLIGGRYAVEVVGGGDVVIDNVARRAGDIIDVAAGTHTMAVTRNGESTGPTKVTLRIASAGPAPSDVKAPTGRLFKTLGFKTK